MQDNYFPVISRAVSGVVLRVPVIYWKYWRNFSFGQFGSICAWSGIRLEILLRFWWEWYFWKWHNPTITQILDFHLYSAYCSVNLKKHLLPTIVNLGGKWTKICWFWYILEKPRLVFEILVGFWWEWYFWKWHNPRITQIIDFCLYNVYCSVNSKKHWLLKFLNFWGKWAKIVEKYTLIHFGVLNKPLLIAKWFFQHF